MKVKIIFIQIKELTGSVKYLLFSLEAALLLTLVQPFGFLQAQTFKHCLCVVKYEFTCTLIYKGVVKNLGNINQQKICIVLLHFYPFALMQF